MEERDNEIFMQSPGRRYLAMPGKLLRKATASVHGGSVPPYRARKKGRCIGRKQQSIFNSGAWTYISCYQRSTNFMFRDYIPTGATGQHVTMKSKFVLFYVQCGSHENHIPDPKVKGRNP